MNKEFSNILNECLERLLVRGETIEECLESYPEQAAELKPLLETALAVKKALNIQPQAEFRARARYQFRTAIEKVALPRSRPALGWLPRWAMVAVIALGLLLVGSGTVVAAGYSMPDSPLYPVKLAAEEAQLKLTRSDIGRAELHVKLADRRVVEIIYMADKGDAQRIEVITERLDKRLVTLAGLVSALDGQEVPKALAPPPVPSPEPRGSRKVDIPGGKRAKARMMMAQYTAHHPAALRAVLEKAPESAKPALRRAIAVSVAGYERATKALD